MDGGSCDFVKVAGVAFQRFVSQPAEENQRADGRRQTEQQ